MSATDRLRPLPVRIGGEDGSERSSASRLRMKREVVVRRW
jgi:hypothetical protein